MAAFACGSDGGPTYRWSAIPRLNLTAEPSPRPASDPPQRISLSSQLNWLRKRCPGG